MKPYQKPAVTKRGKLTDITAQQAPAPKFGGSGGFIIRPPIRTIQS